MVTRLSVAVVFIGSTEKIPKTTTVLRYLIFTVFTSKNKKRYDFRMSRNGAERRKEKRREVIGSVPGGLLGETPRTVFQRQVYSWQRDKNGRAIEPSL